MRHLRVASMLCSIDRSLGPGTMDGQISIDRGILSIAIVNSLFVCFVVLMLDTVQLLLGIIVEICFGSFGLHLQCRAYVILFFALHMYVHKLFLPPYMLHDV